MNNVAPAYAVDANGRITCRNQVIGQLDFETGEIKLDVGLAVSALNQVKARSYDRLQERRPLRGKPLFEIFAPPPLEEIKSAAQPAHDQGSSLLGPDSREEYASYQPPPPPPMDPRLGDKTPAYMRWLGENFPEEYRKRYKGRKTHLSTGINPNLSPGDLPESHFGRDPAEEWK